MTFFLIVPSVMVVSTFLAHTILNRLGLRIHYVTLMMCAFLAIAADLGAIVFSDVPDKFYFLRLAGFLFFAALMTTAANWYLVKREQEEDAKFSEQVQLAYQKKVEPVAAKKVSEVEAVPKEIEIVEPVKVEETPPSVKVEPVAKVNLTKAETKAVKKVEVKAVQKVEVPAKVESQAKVEKPTTKTEAAVKAETTAKVEKPVESAKVEKSAAVEEVPAVKVEVRGETLDDILDYAYLEKQQGHVWQAIAAYKKALEKYRNDEYAPFVAIDLGNIYKEQAFYTKAIKTYEDALELPAVMRSASTKAEFRRNLIYLKTVQSVLLRHKALSTPFSKISRAYLQEIESEFQTMQLKFEN